MSHSIAIEQKKSSFHKVLRPWIVCLSSGLFFFYEFFQLIFFDVVNPSLRTFFHLDATQLGWMSSAYIWGNVLFLLPAGLLLDRVSTRRIILSAMTLCVLATFGFAIVDNVLLATLFHTLTGVANAFCFMSCIVLVSRWFTPHRQALVISLIATMAFIGGVVAHTPLVHAIDHFGWRMALLLDGVLGVLIVFWLSYIISDYPTQLTRTTVQARQPFRSSLLYALRNRQNWLAGIFTACLNLPIMVLCALWGVSYLQVVHGLTAVDASNTVSFILIGSIVGSPLIGWLSDRSGRRKLVMVFGALLTFLLTLPLVMSISFSPAVLSTLFFAIGLASSAQMIGYPVVSESNSLQNTGVAQSVACIVIMSIGGVAQVIFSALLRYHSHGSMHYAVADYRFAMYLFPTAVLVAVCAGLLLRETFCKNLEANADVK